MPKTALSMNLQDQFLRTTALISDEVSDVGTISSEKTWITKILDMIPSPSIDSAPVDGVDYIGGIIGVELIIVAVLTVLVAGVSVFEKILESRLDDQYRNADLDWSVKNNGAKSALRELAEASEYWQDDDLRYRRDLRRRLGRDPFAEAAFATDADSSETVPKTQQPNQNNPSGLNRKMRRMEKYSKKK